MGVNLVIVLFSHVNFRLVLQNRHSSRGGNEMKMVVSMRFFPLTTAKNMGQLGCFSHLTV